MSTAVRPNGRVNCRIWIRSRWRSWGEPTGCRTWCAPSIEATFAAFGLDRGEFDVIGTLRRSGPPYRLTPTELYTSLMISSGGLTHRLDRLEKAGLIRRERSERDGRSQLVALTEAGIARAEEAFRRDMAGESAYLQALDEGERDQLAGLLRKLLYAIEQNIDDDAR